MAACVHRPEEGCSFIACTSAFPEQKCICGVEVLEDEAALVGCGCRWDWGDRVSDLVMQIRTLEAAVDRVRRLHGQYDTSGLTPGKWCPACGQEEPCPTIRALNGQTEEKR